VKRLKEKYVKIRKTEKEEYEGRRKITNTYVEGLKNSSRGQENMIGEEGYRGTRKADN
jgi:hypothetical protein